MGRIDENREWKDVYCSTKYGFICEGTIPETGNEFLLSIQKRRSNSIISAKNDFSHFPLFF